TRPHLGGLCEFDMGRIILRVPEPFRPFSELVYFSARRKPGEGMRFAWISEKVRFRTRRDVLRFVYLHEWLHWYLREMKGRRAGADPAEAARRAGGPATNARRWFRQAGGVLPPSVPEEKSRARYLSICEREEIFAGVERGESIRRIAQLLSRAPSTVLRELRKNMYHQLYRGRSRLRANPVGKRRTRSWRYRPSVAHENAKLRASRPKTAKLVTNRMLRELVQAKLVKKLSPEQISRHLRKQFPDDAEMQVSHETIYQSIYVQGRGALRRELAICLRTGRAMRRPHRNSQERRGRIPHMVNISERPAEVEDRAVAGHWEGDLVI